MDKRTKKGIVKAVIGIVVVFAMAALINFTADVFTIPAANDASVKQLNGGDTEYLEMRTIDQIVRASRGLGWMFASIATLIIVCTTVSNAIEREREKHDPRITSE